MYILIDLLTEMFWAIGELCYLQWETIYYLAGASGELHCLVWKESKWKVWCSLKWITQPRINLSLIHVDTDFFPFLLHWAYHKRVHQQLHLWYSDSLPELMKCPLNCVCFLLPSDKNKMYCLHSLLLNTESCSQRTINFFSFLAPKRYISCLSFKRNLNWI